MARNKTKNSDAYLHATDKKGEWVVTYHGFPPEPTTVCSECGFDRDFNIRARGFGKIKYCPGCGRRII
jgi:NAD-dependent SIR2 family protein deacetylase